VIDGGARAAVAAATLVGAVVTVLATRGSFFTTDDHVFFAQAREQRFGIDFLADPIFDHLSPWHRVHDHVVSSLTDQGWWLAVAIGVLWLVACVAAFALVVRALVGAHPAGTVATVLFALSPVFVRGTQWWALGAQLYPQLCFGLVTLWAALRWQATRRPAWAVLAVAAYALALAGFIKALLVPLLLAVLLHLRPGGGDRAVRPHLPLWAGLAAVTAVYLAIVSGERYYRFIPQTDRAGAGQWLEYLAVGWTQGVVPLVFAGTVDAAPRPTGWVVVAVTCLAAAALVAWTVRRARATALLWAGAAVVVLGALVLSAGARLAEYGVDFVALDPRYNAGARSRCCCAARSPSPPRRRGCGSGAPRRSPGRSRSPRWRSTAPTGSRRRSTGRGTGRTSRRSRPRWTPCGRAAPTRRSSTARPRSGW